MRGLLRNTGVQLALLLIISYLVLVPRLGQVGLRGTEGHRVAPAIAMLRTGELMHPQMFDATYTRKPPGAIWGIAASLKFSGALEHPERLERSARYGSVVITVLMALAAYFFSARWFGKRAALAAGMVQLLTPVVWISARTAEIEPYNNAVTAVSAWLLVDLTVRKQWRPEIVSLFLGLLTGLFLSALLFCKGPASLPAILGLLLAVRLLPRERRKLLTSGLWLAVVTAVVAGVWLQYELSHPPADQYAAGGARTWSHLANFLWHWRDLPGILTLGPAALLMALPMSLPLLYIFRKDFAPHGKGTRSYSIARTLALGSILGLAIEMLIGIHNPRYALPCVIFLSPLSAWLIESYAQGERKKEVGRLVAFTGFALTTGLLAAALVQLIANKQTVAEVPLLMSPMFSALGVLAGQLIIYTWLKPGSVINRNYAVAIVGLLALNAGWQTQIEVREDARSAKPFSSVLAESLPGGAVVWSNDVIEACPELLIYAQLTRDDISFLWRKDLIMQGELPEPGGFLLLRSHEYRKRYRDRGKGGYLTAVAAFTPPKHPSVLFHVEAVAAEGEVVDPFEKLPADEGTSRGIRKKSPGNQGSTN